MSDSMNPNSEPSQPSASIPGSSVSQTGSAMVSTTGFMPALADPTILSDRKLRPEILTATPKPIDLIRALQRRWILAATLALILAIPAAIVAFLVVPVEYRAAAWLRFHDSSDMMFAEHNQPKKDFDPHQTHRELIKAPLVLSAALNRPGIVNLAWLQEVRADNDDEVDWLKGEISVLAPAETSIMRIEMRGDDPNQLYRLVNAVADAYLEKIVDEERNQLLAKRDRLDKSHTKRVEIINTKRTNYHNLARRVGALDKETAALTTQYQLDEASTKREELSILGTRRSELELEKIRFETNYGITDPKDEELKSKMRLRLISQHAGVDERVGRAALAVEQLQYGKDEILKIVPENQATTHYKILEINDLIQKAKDQQSQILGEVKIELDKKMTESDWQPPLLEKYQSLANELSAVEQRYNIVKDEWTAIKEQIRELTEFSPELGQRKDELERLELITDQVGLELEKLDLQLAIEDEQTVEIAMRANPPKMADTRTRDNITIMAGLFGIALSVIGVSLYEFQFRRLSSPHEMSEGLGMRVMGDVPMLTERTWRLPGMNGISRNALQGVMDESIDGIRAMLLHSSGSESLQVVMVTSANSGEGKTTVACSLAASMGRAGRRTLLVDCDMRRPSVHRLLDLPLDSGLCEVLRGEAAVEDVIRPSRATGLWVMSAGRCDHVSLQALTKDAVPQVFEKLRNEFDFIIVDTGPVLAVVDPLLVGQHCDGAILSVVRRVSQISNVFDTCERLRSTGIRILGSVVNGISGNPFGVGYYGYGYGYGETFEQPPVSEQVST